MRDTVESIWVAIVLAFVLRAFIAEAFVIPTGSMAPGLMGEHWRLRCPACGYRYDYGSPHGGDLSRSRRETPTGAECPSCGYLFQYTKMPDYINNGDRVLVMKYSYAFRRFLGMPGPRAWDVIVFKNPQNNRENYIKRLVGLPGETIEIVHGDIFYSPVGDAPMRVRRKPPKVQQVMWRVVFDNDYRPKPDMVVPHERPRWKVLGDQEAWERDSSGRNFVFNGGEVPTSIAFIAARDKYLPGNGYNPPNGHNNGVSPERDVCSDIKLSMVLFPDREPVRLNLNISALEHDFQARISTDGRAGIYYRRASGGTDRWRKLADTEISPMQGGRGHRIEFMNVDMGLGLVIDGRRVLNVDRQYPMDYRYIKRRLAETAANPIPLPSVSIDASGGACEIKHLGVYRDIYYTCPDAVAGIPEGPLGQYARRLKIFEKTQAWGTTNNPIKLKKYPDNPDLDEFFVLGDNSTRSLDGRSWTAAAPSLRLWRKDGEILHRWRDGAAPIYHLGTVPRYNIIGKAMFVYWPSGYRLPALPGMSIIPNVGRMRLIR